MTTTHLFPSTSAAYDACQCDDRVATGDVLLVESEQVAGVAHTWPFAVTAQAGQLHQLAPGYTAADVDPRCGVGAAEACRLAAARGWPLQGAQQLAVTPEEDAAFSALGAKLACTWCTCPLGICRQLTDRRCKNSRRTAPITEEEDLAAMEGQAAEDAKGGLDFAGQPEPDVAHRDEFQASLATPRRLS